MDFYAQSSICLHCKPPYSQYLYLPGLDAVFVSLVLVLLLSVVGGGGSLGPLYGGCFWKRDLDVPTTFSVNNLVLYNY